MHMSFEMFKFNTSSLQRIKKMIVSKIYEGKLYCLKL